jgi:hypothetical protein
MSLHIASKSTNINIGSNSKESVDLPEFNGKNWNKSWDNIAKQARLDKALIEMDMAASSQGVTGVTKNSARETCHGSDRFDDRSICSSTEGGGRHHCTPRPYF